MGKRNAFLKDGLRKVRATLHRFLAILVITALGVAFFAGLRATGPNMRATASDYFVEQSFMDIRLLSNYGINEADLKAIKSVEGIAKLMPAYSLDALAQLSGKNMTVRLHSLPRSGEDDVNAAEIVEGRMPQKSGECLADEQFMKLADYKIGDTVDFRSGTDTPIHQNLDHEAYTIVGIARNPLYISYDRGSGSVGSGKAEAFFLLPASDFKLEVYTEVYMIAQNPKGISRFDDSYGDLLAPIMQQLERVGEWRSAERYMEIREDASEELIDAQKKVDDGYAELEDGRTQLEEAARALFQGRSDYETGSQRFDSEIAAARGKLDEGGRELQKGWAQYNSQKEAVDAEFAAHQAKIDAGYAEYYTAVAEYRSQLAIYKQEEKVFQGNWEKLGQGELAFKEEYARYEARTEKYENLTVQLEAGNTPESLALIQAMAEQLGQENPQLALALQAYVADPSDGQKQDAARGAVLQFGEALVQAEVELDQTQMRLAAERDGLEQYGAALAAISMELDGAGLVLEQTKKDLDAASAELDGARRQAQAELDAGKSRLEGSAEALEQGRQELEQQKDMGQQELDEALAELEQGESEYEDGLAEFSSEELTALRKLEQAQTEIDQGYEKLDELRQPEWYVLDHETNIGFIGYKQDARRVEALSLVMPVLFFLVAILVTMTSMTRLVESDRTQIGTLKALGYSDGRIAAYYLWYAIAASAIGGMIGLLVGFNIFPRLVFNAYASLYTLPPIVLQFNWPYALVSLGLAVGCAALPSYFVCLRSTRQAPAHLMRPQAPGVGKRTLLERMTFIWKRFNFSQKVALRNLFRYRKRLIMTVVGVAGCTALMFTGFGMRDAVSTIVTKQYDEIQRYEMRIDLQKNLSDADRAALEQMLDDNEMLGSQVMVRSEAVDVEHGSALKSAYLTIPQTSAGIDGYLHLKNRRTGESLALGERGIVLTEKLADMLGVLEGDTVSIRNEDGQRAEVVVDGITENYVSHYIYMSVESYGRAFARAPEANQIWCLPNQDADWEREALSETLLNHSAVASLSFTTTMQESMEKMVGALHQIVLVLILSAAALVFVVLFSLTTISLEERSRELATIKVLGFFDRELAAYIYRENAVLTVLGTGLGLLLGVLLQRYVIGTMEID
ncbi:MAG: FtsX-like permease family protein, partial [Christensenellales bacterium]